MKYEGFVRGAFSLNNEESINRGEDPAHLAEAGYWNLNNVDKVKTGTAYAMAIYNAHIIEVLSREELGEEVYAKIYYELEDLLHDVLQATDLLSISTTLDKYQPYKDRYIRFRWQHQK